MNILMISPQVPYPFVGVAKNIRNVAEADTEIKGFQLLPGNRCIKKLVA